MIRNYLTVTLRTLRKHPAYTLINIVGLAVGIAFCALIFLYVRDELTYDRFHTQADRLYRVLTVYFNPDGSESNQGSNHPVPLGPSLVADIPEIAQSVRLRTLSHYVRTTGDAIEEDVLYADPSLLDMFTFPLRRGNPATALTDPNSAVLTQTIAHKYFGDADPIGRTLQIRLQDTFEDFVVSGVAEDVPGNSTIQFGILLPFDRLLSYHPTFKQYADSWELISFQTYVRLADNTTLQDLNTKLAAFYAQYHGEYLAEQREKESWAAGIEPATYRLQPLREIHLASVSDPIYSYILSAIALAILLIACINFMTLAIGRSVSRAREVGVRKVMGAGRLQLMGQFWGEAVVQSFLALVLGLLLAEVFLPVFNTLSGKTLRFDYLANGSTLAMLAGLMLMTGLIAGSYPAVVLSGFQPIETLKSRMKLSGSNAFTKSLIVVQFALSVFLITGTLIMTQQLDYTRSKSLGYNTEQIIVIPTSGLDGRQMAERFRTRLRNDPHIVDVTATGNTLGQTGTSGFRFQHEGKRHTLSVFSVETNYLDFLGLDLVQGRAFDPNLATDSTQSVLVNEALVRDFDMETPLGQMIPGLPGGEDNPRYIVGVVKDYHFQSLYKELAPVMLTLDPAWGYNYLFIRIRPDDIPGSIARLQTTWETTVTDLPFTYSFLDDDMAAQYRDDQRWGQIVRYAALFAMLIACLGLFGLAALTVTRRTKEIGIRKVLGASVSRIVALLSREWVLLVGLGVLIAAPVAYVVMHRWLEDFAYRVDISGWIFLLAGLAALGVALLTVSYQSIRAALNDPVESLRYE